MLLSFSMKKLLIFTLRINYAAEEVFFDIIY
jgi:hypothetical protein